MVKQIIDSDSRFFLEYLDYFTRKLFPQNQNFYEFMTIFSKLSNTDKVRKLLNWKEFNEELQTFSEGITPANTKSLSIAKINYQKANTFFNERHFSDAIEHYNEVCILSIFYNFKILHNLS